MYTAAAIRDYNLSHWPKMTLGCSEWTWHRAVWENINKLHKA